MSRLWLGFRKLSTRSQVTVMKWTSISVPPSSLDARVIWKRWGRSSVEQTTSWSQMDMNPWSGGCVLRCSNISRQRLSNCGFRLSELYQGQAHASPGFLGITMVKLSA
jgi:hypothetical protein